MGAGCSFQKKNSNNKDVNDPKDIQSQNGKKNLKQNNQNTIQIESNLKGIQNSQLYQKKDEEYEIGPILFQKLIELYPEKNLEKQKQIWNQKLQKNNQKKKSKEIIEHLQKDIQTYLKSVTEEDLYIYKFLNGQDFINTMYKTVPPISLRWSIWKLRLLEIENYDKNLYDKLLVQQSCQEQQILKDIGRSFPDYKYFQVINNHSYGQDALYRVLKAISIFYSDMGYTQGMNFVIGFLLLMNGGNEVEVFWFFVELCRNKDFMLMGMYEEEFIVLKLLLFIFYKKFQLQLPQLYEHFIENGMDENLWIWKWLLTIYVYNFPIECVLRIWDYLLATNIFGVIQLSISYLQKIQDQLLEMDMQEICEYFKEIKENPQYFLDHDQENSIDIERVIDNAKSVQISSGFIQQSTVEFCQENNIQNEYYTNYFKCFGKKDKKSQKYYYDILEKKCLDQETIEKIKQQIQSPKTKLQNQNIFLKIQQDDNMIQNNIEDLSYQKSMRSNSVYSVSQKQFSESYSRNFNKGGRKFSDKFMADSGPQGQQLNQSQQNQDNIIVGTRAKSRCSSSKILRQQQRSNNINKRNSKKLDIQQQQTPQIMENQEKQLQQYEEEKIKENQDYEQQNSKQQQSQENNLQNNKIDNQQNKNFNNIQQQQDNNDKVRDNDVDIIPFSSDEEDIQQQNQNSTTNQEFVFQDTKRSVQNTQRSKNKQRSLYALDQQTYNLNDEPVNVNIENIQEIQEQEQLQNNKVKYNEGQQVYQQQQEVEQEVEEEEEKVQNENQIQQIIQNSQNIDKQDNQTIIDQISQINNNQLVQQYSINLSKNQSYIMADQSISFIGPNNVQIQQGNANNNINNLDDKISEIQEPNNQMSSSDQMNQNDKNGSTKLNGQQLYEDNSIILDN